ncbi:hypothetical protein GE061_009284 [Apolygus lucorum]|uniref:Uncharacterized protein n=1 Tax=Apolygus lucorum TaxID=248454 RepID=A0A8S9Y1V3_APOLU|nr:hypothetical protein GE061_009284 [Apolygus lucorum]
MMKLYQYLLAVVWCFLLVAAKRRTGERQLSSLGIGYSQQDPSDPIYWQVLQLAIENVDETWSPAPNFYYSPIETILEAESSVIQGEALSSVVTSVVLREEPPLDKICTPGFMEWEEGEDRCTCDEERNPEKPEQLSYYCSDRPKGISLYTWIYGMGKLGREIRQHRASYGERRQQSPALALSGRSTLIFNQEGRPSCRLHVPPPTKESTILKAVFSPNPGSYKWTPEQGTYFAVRVKMGENQENENQMQLGDDNGLVGSPRRLENDTERRDSGFPGVENGVSSPSVALNSQLEVNNDPVLNRILDMMARIEWRLDGLSKRLDFTEEKFSKQGRVEAEKLEEDLNRQCTDRSNKMQSEFNKSLEDQNRKMNILFFFCVIALSSVVSGDKRVRPPEAKMCTPGFMKWEDPWIGTCTCYAARNPEKPDHIPLVCVGPAISMDANGNQHYD